MSWRGLAGPAALRCRSLGTSRPRKTVPRHARPDCSGCARRATGAPCGAPVPIARVQRLARSGCLTGSAAIARCRLRETVPSRHHRLLGWCRRGTSPAASSGDHSPVHTSEPVTGRRGPTASSGLPLLAVPRESPPGPVPVPGDNASSSARAGWPTRAFRRQFPAHSASTRLSTAVDDFSPGHPALSTASSTVVSTATSAVSTIRTPVKRHSDRSVAGASGALPAGQLSR